MKETDSQAIGALVRTLTRPIVTLVFAGAAVAAGFVFKQPEFIFGTAGLAVGFWFSDRSKESEAQRLAYGAAQDRSNAAATKANIEIIETQNKFSPPATKPVDATKPPIGYRTLS